MSEKDPETSRPEPRPAKVGAPWHRSERVRLVAFILATLAALGTVALVSRFRNSLPIEESLKRIEARLKRARRPNLVKELRASCHPRGCACAKAAANLGLEIEASAVVLELEKSARAGCSPAAAFDGFEAERLVRDGKDAEGKALALRVLAADAKNPNALYAQALASYHVHDVEKATSLAERAADAGRGSTAHLLRGLIAFHTGDLDRAQREFGEMLKADPGDIDALYNLGLVAQKLNHYGEARTSYLRVTRIDPKNMDSRYNLGILTHSVGADEEARHHLEELRKIPKSAERVRLLEAALAVPPEHPPAHVLKLETPPSAVPPP